MQKTKLLVMKKTVNNKLVNFSKYVEDILVGSWKRLEEQNIKVKYMYIRSRKTFFLQFTMKFRTTMLLEHRTNNRFNQPFNEIIRCISIDYNWQ